MWFSSWLRTWKRFYLGQRRRVREAPRQRPSLRPRLEVLEDRTLLSIYTAGSVSALVADINSANQTGGSNTINLTPNTIFDLTAVNNTTNGANGLPVISGGGTQIAADNLTIVGNGDTIERSTASGTPAFRLFDAASGSSLTLDNVTLQDGLAFGSGTAAEGGAVYNQGTVTLSGVTMQGNTAQGSAGADASTTTTTTKIKGKTHVITVTVAAQPGANAEGGGVWSSGSVTLANGTTLQSNKAIGGQGGNGLSYGSERFSGQGGSGLGGGLYVAGGSVHATSMANESAAIFSGNEAMGGAGGGLDPHPYASIEVPGHGGSGLGGGLYLTGGSVSAIGTGNASAAIFSGNEALGGDAGIGLIPGTSFSYQVPWGGGGSGGGLYVAGGTLDMSRDTVQSNQAVGGTGGGAGFSTGPGVGGMGGYGTGGGLYVAGTGVVVTLADVNLSSNLAEGGQGGNASVAGFGGNGDGGGLLVYGATVTLTGDTVTANQAIGGFLGLGNTAVVEGYGDGTGTGGGIYNNGGTLTVSASVFSSNNPDNINGSYTEGGPMLEISGSPSPTTAGTLDTFTLTVLNSSGNTWTNYTGKVHFTSSDFQAVLPADYSFTSADQGVHTFTATFKTAGTQSVTVTDINTPTLTDTDGNVTVNPAATSQLVLAGFPSVTAGVTGFMTVSAEDPYGNATPNYTGTVAFKSSAAQATLPANYTFTSSDNGVHTFSASLQSAGRQSITVTDTTQSSMTSTQSGIVISPTNPVRFTVAAPANVTTGTPFSITVTAWDAYNNIATNYTGTVSFTSTDGAAVLPTTYTFTTADKGVHTFTNGVTLKTSGTQTVTATGTAVPAGIVSWWPGDGNTNDIVGSNNGTLVGGATYGTGMVNQAFNFPSAGAYFKAPANGLPTGNSDRTLELWVYVNAYTTNESFFAGYGSFGTATETYQLGTSGSTLFFSQWGNAIFGPSLQTGIWYNVAVTNVGNYVTLYLNGTAVASGNLTINTPSGTQFYMGSPAGDSSRQLDGLTDEAALYNRALSPTEIQSIYNAGSAGKHQTITGSASVSVGTAMPG